MGFYNKFYIVYYQTMNRNTEDGKKTNILALGLVTLAQLIHLLLIVEVVENVWRFRILSILPGKPIMMVFLLFWTYALSLYYTKTKTEKIIEEFKELKDSRKDLWTILAFGSFIFSFIILQILLWKPI